MNGCASLSERAMSVALMAALGLTVVLADEPSAADFDAIPVVKSPVIMKSVFGSRHPASRTEAIRDYGISGVTEGTVVRSLRWLKSVQNPDGSWGGEADACDAGTALALLAFMGHGETPASDEYGDAVQRGFRFLIGDMKQPGRLERKGQPPAFGRGISAWALCEGHALTRVPFLKSCAEDALAVIVKGQRESGLWDVLYRTDEGWDNVEASAWQVMAVRSGLVMGSEMGGLRECLRRAADGMEKSLATDTNLSTVAAAAYCLQLAGRGHKPACRAAVERLSAYAPNWDAPDCRDPVFRWYLTGQAMFHQGGRSWGGWNRTFTPMLVARQTIQMVEGGRDTGWWESPGGGERYGRIYSTALSTMALQVYYAFHKHYVPPPDSDEGAPARDEDVEIRIEL